MPLKILILVAFVFTHTLVNGQQLVKTGIVVQTSDKEPVPFASISIVNSNRGTSADAAGKFTFSYLPGDSLLKVSSIGYKTKFFKISILHDTSLVLQLQPETIELEALEITQAKINAKDIVRYAVDSIAVNYKKDSFNLQFHSLIQATNSMSKKEFEIESILLGYYNGYASGKKKFEITTKRSRGEDPLKVKQYPYWPTLEIHRGDLISDPAKTGIFDIKNLDKFMFEYAGVVSYDGDTVYHIKYHAPKPTQKITGYQRPPTFYTGEVFITVNSYAIVKHDLSTNQFQHSIVYKKINDQYFPYLIRGERQLPGDSFTKVTNTITMINMITANPKVIESRTNEFDSIDTIEEDPEYWDLNFPMQKD